jgi:hypothetical protein
MIIYTFGPPNMLFEPIYLHVHLVFLQVIVDGREACAAA